MEATLSLLVESTGKVYAQSLVPLTSPENIGPEGGTFNKGRSLNKLRGDVVSRPLLLINLLSLQFWPAMSTFLSSIQLLER